LKKISIDIVQILQDKMALHVGNKVRAHIDKHISNDSPILVLLNLKDADPIDYEFINNAFAEIVKKSLKEENIFIAFIGAGKWETEELYTGLTKIFDLKDGGDSDKEILIKNDHNFIIINTNNDAIYLTSLNDRNMKVLKEIDEKGSIYSSQIQEKFKFNAEETTEILNTLLRCKFIYKTEGPVYHSIKCLIFK
jgi:hypothetical protein